MKTLILQRDKETQHSDLGTKGILSENGVKICDTLELHEENNKKRESHIPTGKYLCKIVNSPKFGKVYEITNVPNRGNVLIHSGNFAGDTDKGYKSDVLGCVEVGNGYGIIEYAPGKKQFGILKSKLTFNLFMQYMKDLPFYLEVKE